MIDYTIDRKKEIPSQDANIRRAGHLKKFIALGKVFTWGEEGFQLKIVEGFASTKKEFKLKMYEKRTTIMYNEIFNEKEWDMVTNEIAVTKRQYNLGLVDGSYDTRWYKENKIKQT